MSTESTRIDKWLWAVRLYKTRAAAAEACRGGHVKLNAERTKPAATVKVGDTVRAYTGNLERIVKVEKIIEKRVGAPIAVACYEDHSPPPPPRVDAMPQRPRGAGRPTKRERRQLERLRGRRGR